MSEEETDANLDVVATTAHELKSPLTLISSIASMLKGEDFGELNAQQKHQLQRIELTSDRLLRLVKNLLNVQQVQQGRITARVEPVPIQAVLSDVVTELKPKADQNKIEINLTGASIPPVLADQDFVHIIFYNLIDNALKYSPQTSIVKVFFKKAQHNLRVYVSDEGTGIRPRDFGRIFSAQQGGGLLAAKSNSSGLGLYIVRELVELLGGNVNVDISKKGNCFSVSLPTTTQLSLLEDYE